MNHIHLLQWSAKKLEKLSEEERDLVKKVFDEGVVFSECGLAAVRVIMGSSCPDIY